MEFLPVAPDYSNVGHVTSLEGDRKLSSRVAPLQVRQNHCNMTLPRYKGANATLPVFTFTFQFFDKEPLSMFRLFHLYYFFQLMILWLNLDL